MNSRYKSKKPQHNAAVTRPFSKGPKSMMMQNMQQPKPASQQINIQAQIMYYLNKNNHKQRIKQKPSLNINEANESLPLEIMNYKSAQQEKSVQQ